MSQSGGASESFSYTKNYEIDGSGNWQCSTRAEAAMRQRRGLGQGWTLSSYSGSAPYSTSIPGSVASAVGRVDLGHRKRPAERQQQQLLLLRDHGRLQRHRLERDRATRLPRAAATRATPSPLQASGLTFTTPFSNGDGSPLSTCGSAGMSGTDTTSYDYSEQAFLDDNGTWQIGQAGGSSAGSGSFTAGGSASWSLAGSSPYETTLYGNPANGTMNSSGSGADSYEYTQSFNFQPGGQWAARSGTGSASGSGSVSSGYAVSGGYTTVDPALGRRVGHGGCGRLAGDGWSGTTSGTASQTTPASTTGPVPFSARRTALASVGQRHGDELWVGPSRLLGQLALQRFGRRRGHFHQWQHVDLGNGLRQRRRLFGLQLYEKASLRAQRDAGTHRQRRRLGRRLGQHRRRLVLLRQRHLLAIASGGSLSGTLGESGDQAFYMDYHDGTRIRPTEAGLDGLGQRCGERELRLFLFGLGRRNGQLHALQQRDRHRLLEFEREWQRQRHERLLRRDERQRQWLDARCHVLFVRQGRRRFAANTASDTHPAGRGYNDREFRQQVADDKISENGQVTSGQSPRQHQRVVICPGGTRPWAPTRVLRASDEYGRAGFSAPRDSRGNSVRRRPLRRPARPSAQATFFGTARLPRSIPSAPDAETRCR